MGIRGYPRSQEEYERQCATLARNRNSAKARGIYTPIGTPHGWGHRKKQLIELRAHAKDEAKRIVNKMREDGKLTPPPGMSVKDVERSEEALEAAIAVIRAKADSTLARLKAAQIVLEYTRTKPAAKTDVTVHSAEAFLEDIAREIKDD